MLFLDIFCILYFELDTLILLQHYVSLNPALIENSLAFSYFSFKLCLQSGVSTIFTNSKIKNLELLTKNHLSMAIYL